MLTRESILAFKPCRRTNWLIHMVVMGNKAWKHKRREGDRYVTRIRFAPEKPTWPDEVYTEIQFEDLEEGRVLVEEVPNYTGDLSAAWKAEKKAMDSDELDWAAAVTEVLGIDTWGLSSYNVAIIARMSALDRSKAALLTTIREDKQ